MPDLATVVAAELSLARAAVERTVALLTGGATVPFIARYRKEATGGLDEVQIGHQDGLVHVSELANRFVRDPAEVVKVGDRIRVKVLKIDGERRRIGLSLKEAS